MLSKPSSVFSFFARVWADIQTANLDLGGHQKVLLAVSGGMDSMALLHFCDQVLGPRYGCQFAVAHVNHNLRPDSKSDLAFVRRAAENLNLEFFSCDLQPPENFSGESVENWARHHRYGFLRKTAKMHGYAYIFTAHHLDDQLETLYMKIARGTGLKGLRGIHLLGAGGVVRPMLSVSKKELREYAQAQVIHWRVDSTNFDWRFTRNQMRRNLASLKGLEREQTLLSAGNLAKETWALWKQIGSWLGLFILGGPKGGWFVPSANLAKLRNEFPDLEFELVAECCERNSLPFSQAHWEEYYRQNRQSAGKAARVQLTTGKWLILDKNGLSLRQFPAAGSEELYDSEPLTVELNGRSTHFKGEFQGKILELRALRYAKPAGFEAPKSRGPRVTLDGDTISSKLIIRTRNPGDIFIPLGLDSHGVKLKKFLTNRKLSKEEKDRQLLVCQGDSVIWLPGLEISHHCQVSSTTQEILEIEISHPI